MENYNTTDDQEQPSTSKKESERNNSVDDIYVDSHDDDVANSEISIPSSGTYSVISKLDMAGRGPDLPNSSIPKDIKGHQKRKGVKAKRITGRIEKKRRPVMKRQAIRRAPKRRPRAKEGKKEKNISMSTIFTRLSSSSQTQGCEYCGHRCCRRRFENELRRWFQNCKMKRRRRKYKKNKKLNKVMKTEGTQAGSCSNMFSPLFIATNSSPNDEPVPEILHSEISPDMIHEALRKLTMWKQDVQTTSILEYLIIHYPVNKDKDALMDELLEKLRITAMLGIVCRTSENTWSLTPEFEKRRVNRNHVTLFWKMYADTLRPVTAKQVREPEKQPETDKETTTRTRILTIYKEDIL